VTICVLVLRHWQGEMEVGGFLTAGSMSSDSRCTMFLPIRAISDPSTSDKHAIETAVAVGEHHLTAREYAIRNAARLLHALVTTDALPVQLHEYRAFLEERGRRQNSSLARTLKLTKSLMQEQEALRATLTLRRATRSAVAVGSGGGVAEEGHVPAPTVPALTSCGDAGLAATSVPAAASAPEPRQRHAPPTVTPLLARTQCGGTDTNPGLADAAQPPSSETTPHTRDCDYPPRSFGSGTPFRKRSNSLPSITLRPHFATQMVTAPAPRASPRKVGWGCAHPLDSPNPPASTARVRPQASHEPARAFTQAAVATVIPGVAQPDPALTLTPTLSTMPHPIRTVPLEMLAALATPGTMVDEASGEVRTTTVVPGARLAELCRQTVLTSVSRHARLVTRSSGGNTFTFPREDGGKPWPAEPDDVAIDDAARAPLASVMQWLRVLNGGVSALTWEDVRHAVARACGRSPGGATKQLAAEGRNAV